jgi:hypothetical protein
VARRRTIRVPDVTGGLTDFPELAAPGNADLAVNVEYRNGGVSTRPGTLRRTTMVNSLHSFRGFWHYRTHLGASYYLFAYVITDGGANHREGRLLVLDTGGVILQTLNFQSTFANDVTFEMSARRWGGLSWQDAGNDETIFIIGTDKPARPPGGFASPLWTVEPVAGGPLGLFNLLPADRSVGPFWGVINTDITKSDDLGPYIPSNNENIGGQALSVHNNRLVTSMVDFSEDWNNRFSVRVSNLGDKQGWPQPGYVLYGARDPLEVTAIADWEGRMLVWTRSSMWTTQYESPANHSTTKVLNDTGCIAQDTVKQITKAGRSWVVWLAEDGLYAWAGGSEPKYISKNVEKRLRAALAAGANVTNSHAFHDPVSNQYYLQIDGSDEVMIWDYEYDAWSTWEFRSGAVVIRPEGWAWETDHTTTAAMVARVAVHRTDFISMRTNGYVDDFLGASLDYTSSWRSSPIPFGRNEVARVRYIRPTVSMQEDNNTRAIYWQRDNESRATSNALGQNTTIPGFPVLPSGGAATFGNITFNQEQFGAQKEFYPRADCFGGPTKTIQVGIEEVTRNQPFHLLALELDIVSRGVRR